MSIIGSNILAGASGVVGEAGVYTYTIDQSLRFEDGSSAYLSRTPASAGNRKTWTWSGWVKRGNLGITHGLLEAFSSVDYQTNFYFSTANNLIFQHRTSTNKIRCDSAMLFRDSSAWYHIVLAVDTTQASSSDGVRCWVNGEQISFTPSTYVQNTDTYVNDTKSQRIGFAYPYSADGYMAEVHFIDGSALGPEYFGVTDDTWGIWKPIEYTGSYGTNGFYLDFSNGAAIGADSSGNSNDWTANNLAATDIMLDSPTNNWCTLNPLARAAAQSVFSEGNLKHLYNAAVWSGVSGTFGITSGKWYWETRVLALNSYVGIVLLGTGFNYYQSNPQAQNGYIGYYANTGAKNVDNVSTSYGSSYASGDILGIALDMDSGTLTFYKNGVSQGDIDLTTTAYWGATAIPMNVIYYNGSILNFGQDSSFAGNETAQGNTDSNGYGDFYYSVPSGFLSLCSANLEEAAVIPSENFNTVLYTGNGSTQSITGVGFQPDFVWNKGRNAAFEHRLFNSVAGSTQHLRSNSTAAELTSTAGKDLASFDSDGFSLGLDEQAYINTSTINYVAWNWKADNTSGSTNTDGSITSTVAANPDAGFSIVSYTGTGSNATVGHGLSSAPEMVIVKNRSYGYEWNIYHQSIGATGGIYFDTGAAKTGYIDFWNNTAPTSTVITVGTNSNVNQNTASMIAYCFHSVPGYSKFGSYEGNSSTDGTFVYTGFSPAFIMVKPTDAAGDWHMLDIKRDGLNPNTYRLFANSASSEGFPASPAYDIDILSNGFKLRTSSSYLNTNTFIYMAFASSPFKYSTAR